MAGEYLSYEQMPYLGRIHRQSHVSNLAVIGTLFGLQPAPPPRCRVLEVGCADATNLIAMAYNLPGAEFVGIDGSEGQIASGRQLARDIGVDNVDLRALDLREVDESLGQFDYIIAHGIYSWIAPETRRALMRLCRERLTEQGIAYVSYNTYPGWHFYDQIRGMMRFHIRGMETIPDEINQARAIMRFVDEHLVDKESPRAAFLRDELPDILKMNDDYVYHEYLEENNRPLYFHEFIREARASELQYLGEAMFHGMVSSNYPAQVAETLERISNNIIELEQYMDFLRNRRFRCTLLCHRERELVRAIDPALLEGLLAALPFRTREPAPDLAAPGPLEFVSTHDDTTTIVVEHPLHKLTLGHLAARWPDAVPLTELAARCASGGVQMPPEAVMSELCDLMMQLYSQSFVELRAYQPPVSPEVTEHPRVTRMARYQAAQRRVVASQTHDMFQLGDPNLRTLIALLDGSRTIAELAAELAPQYAADVDVREVIVDMLGRLARAGVLLPPGAADG